jgi:large subunit ribosomal protein L21
MAKFAVIETGGKQYLVKPGDVIRVEKIGPSTIRQAHGGEQSRTTKLGAGKPKMGKAVNFDKVLLIADGQGLKLGSPYIKNAKVVGEWQEEIKGKKVTVFRYHSKTRYRKKKGHRQAQTKVLIKDF